MNSWLEISDRYEGTPEMVAFREWCFKNGFEDGGHPIAFTKSNIKTIFGFIIRYASEFGMPVMINRGVQWQVPLFGKLNSGIFEVTDKDMLFTVDKYFELITKKGE